MALTPGTRLGVYEITAQIGEGGMGAVYRATDTSLSRQVAIKVLPDAFAADPNRLARFEREAKTLAALNHPHIAGIYAIETSAGATALVMELVEGNDLSERIARGVIPLDEVLPIARQIAEALEAAHEQGIVHRDLKPANIKVRADGTVKVLDFGLAKAMDRSGESGGSGRPGGHDLSASPTLTSPAMTQAGMILGTAAYMAPEQARGRTVDRRADIWAFGAVLFEMLTGTRAFPGEDVTDTLVAVMSAEPDFDALPSTVPGRVVLALRVCLRKDPKQRAGDIRDVRLALEGAFDTTTSPSTQASTPSSRGRLPWLIAGTAVGAMLALAIGARVTGWRTPDVPSARAVRLSLGSPGQFFTEPPSAVISPDGNAIVFVAADASGKDAIWLRALAAQDPRVLPGTERGDVPFWSPDSRSVGFFADGQLKIVDTVDGSVRTLARSPVSAGATWSQDGTILVAQASGTFGKTSAAGGAIAPLSPPVRGNWPHFLPDGRHFLFHSVGREFKPAVLVGSIGSAETRHLIDSDFEATYAPPGYLLFVEQETLMAQPFDATRLELSGRPTPIANGAWVARGYAHGVFSAGANGTLLYVNAAIANTQLAWFDREGRSLGGVGKPGRYDSPPQLSPDGSTVAIARGPFFQQDVWLLDSARDTETRFTFDPAGSRVPVWMRDASHVLFQSLRGDGRSRVYQKNPNGSGSDDIVDARPGVNLQDVSPDGRYVVYMVTASGKFELWLLPRFGDRTPTPFLQTQANNGQAQVSPDGHWIMYTSNESGRDEVYVQSFPTPGSKHQVSIDGGAQGRWRRSGGELFYLAPDRTLMAAPVTTGATFQVGHPVPLFRTHLEFLGLQGPYFMPGYDVTTDGKRFLLNAPPAQAVPPIDVILNWQETLTQTLPAR